MFPVATEPVSDGFTGGGPTGCAEQRLVLRENCCLELAQLRTRLDADRLDQHVAGILERPQGIRLPPRPVQGPDELSPTSLAQRFRGHERLQLGRKSTMPAEGQLGVDQVLDGSPSQLLQPQSDRARQLRVRNATERGAPPQLERASEQFGDSPSGRRGRGLPDRRAPRTAARRHRRGRCGAGSRPDEW